MTLREVEDAVSLVKDTAGGDANIIFGAAVSGEKKEEVEVTVIATGIEREPRIESKISGEYDLEIPTFQRREPKEDVQLDRGRAPSCNTEDLEIPTFIRRQMD